MRTFQKAMWWLAPPPAHGKRQIHGKEMIRVSLFREEVIFKVNKTANTVLK